MIIFVGGALAGAVIGAALSEAFNTQFRFTTRPRIVMAAVLAFYGACLAAGLVSARAGDL